MNDVAPIPQGGEIIEQVIAKGDLAKLTAEERTRYYVEVCRSIGLNPLTKPFEYITLNGKLTLYANKGCADQLRTNRGVSVVEMTDIEREGVYVVTCKVKDAQGRTDMAKGAVVVGGVKGEALCNAIMKAETKAKRRATLSLCGLGMLDESEIETIPARAIGPAAPATLPVYDPETGEVDGPYLIPLENDDWIGWGGKLVAGLNAAGNREEAEAWLWENREMLDRCDSDAPKVAGRINANVQATRQRLPDFTQA